MKITPVTQNKNNANFKGASSIAKYSDELQNVITNAINGSFENVLKQVEEKAPSKISEFINNIPAIKKINKKTNEIYKKGINGIAWLIGQASDTKLSKKLVNGLSHFKKPSARMADLASFAITFFYVNNTRKSKKIEKERKMPLMINNITVTVVSSTMAALIDKGSDVILDRVKGALCLKKGEEVLNNVIKNASDLIDKTDGKSIEQLAEDILKSKEFRIKVKDYTKRFEKAKSLTVFSFTVRFLVTVLMVPVAGKIVKIVKEKMAKTPQTESK